MAEFQPPANWMTHGCDGKFISFAASVEKRTLGSVGKAQGKGGREEILSAFFNQYNLQGDAQQKLWSLPEDVQDLVMAEFQPPANWMTHGCDGKFISFAASVEKRTLGSVGKAQGKGGGATVVKRPPPADGQSMWAPSGNPKRPRFVEDGWSNAAGVMNMPTNVQSSSTAFTPDPQAAGRILEFVQKWRLNEDAVVKLERLSPPALESVLTDFNPPETNGSDDWTGRLIVFASSIEKNIAQDPVKAFVARWHLNKDSVQKIHQLSAEQLHIMMTQFNPPLDNSDLNGKFISFAASVQRRH